MNGLKKPFTTENTESTEFFGIVPCGRGFLPYGHASVTSVRSVVKSFGKPTRLAAPIF